MISRFFRWLARLRLPLRQLPVDAVPIQMPMLQSQACFFLENDHGSLLTAGCAGTTVPMVTNPVLGYPQSAQLADLQSPLFTWACSMGIPQFLQFVLVMSQWHEFSNGILLNLQLSQHFQISWRRGKVTIVSLLVSPFLLLFARFLPVVDHRCQGRDRCISHSGNSADATDATDAADSADDSSLGGTCRTSATGTRAPWAHGVRAVPDEFGDVADPHVVARWSQVVSLSVGVYRHILRFLRSGVRSQESKI